jgi:DNA-binding NtrC family response regulator
MASSSGRFASTDPALPETVLVVDDDVSLVETLRSVLEDVGYRVLAAPEGAKAMALMQQENVDLVLTDLVMSGTTGEELLVDIRRAFPDIPVVAMTAFASVPSAAAVTRLGAAEYLSKPMELNQLRDVVRALLERSAPDRQRRRARQTAGKHFHGIIGRSRAMKQLFQQVNRIAPSTVPVLIAGETGSGKELIARALHGASGREPFVPLNCGAIPAGLLESELFGHVRGAFTGADRDHTGLFETAHGGTLFLDEIAELPVGLQAKLLRVLQSGELRRVGDVQPRYVTVRLIAATHRDLHAAIASGAFREDLYYRINVLHLSVPPLRERSTDIPLLAEDFLQQIATREGQPPRQLSPAALAHLVAYPWPGNVRQLLNVLERTAILAEREILEVEDLPAEVRNITTADPLVSRIGTELTLDELEREHILGVLGRVGGNRSRAAKLLGLPRRTLYRRLEDYGVRIDDD